MKKVFLVAMGVVCWAGASLTSLLGSLLPRGDTPREAEGKTRCYDELGCLSITKDWHHLMYRPINLFPLAREVINTRFVLYTRKNPEVGQTLKAVSDKTIQNSNFDAKKQTKFIIHGFMETIGRKWVEDMRMELLMHSDWNVVEVDWAGGSLPLYTQATANTRLVGLEIAYLINHLKDRYGLKPADVHIIGHSLGAHTAGYAGERVEGLGRITGLDPAGPYFQGLPPHVRLDPTDALLVDNIHTDGRSILLLGLGMSEPCGHIDFYPNNGKEQPGCHLSDARQLPITLMREGMDEATRVLLTCSHMRSVKIFIESINSDCPYIGYLCPSHQLFLQGQCFSCGKNGTGCAVMGLNVQKGIAPPGSKYFFTTGKKKPYCRYHYRVTLDLAKPSKAKQWVRGSVRATLHGATNDIVRTLDLTPSGGKNFQHGTSISFIVTHSDDIGPVRKVDLYWEYDTSFLQPRSICLLWCNDSLYVSSVKVEETRDVTATDNRATEKSSKLCTSGRQYAEIQPRGTMLFSKQC